MRRTRHHLLKRASAYYRVSAKAARAGNRVSAAHYMDIADRAMAEYHRRTKR